MFIVTLTDNFHGNKEGFISLTMEDVKKHLIEHLDNWDCQYTEAELAYILEAHRGFADEDSKTYIEVWIKEIQPGQGFDLL